MRLYLVRHAEAAPGEPDTLRPLTSEGRRQASHLAERLAGSSPRPAALLCSPLLRARETAELLARPLGLAPEADDRLGPGATAEGVRAAVAGRGEAVVVVGHQPDCGRIAAELTGGAEPAFPPAGVFEVEVR
jgi:phosphohistidine phosphatase